MLDPLNPNLECSPLKPDALVSKNHSHKTIDSKEQS